MLCFIFGQNKHSFLKSGVSINFKFLQRERSFPLQVDLNAQERQNLIVLIYTRPTVVRTLMARLPRLFRTPS